MLEQVKHFRDVLKNVKGLSLPSFPHFLLSKESMEVVGVSVQHLLEKLFRPTVSLPPHRWGPGVTTAHRHSGCPGLVDLGKAGPRKGKLGGKTSTN